MSDFSDIASQDYSRVENVFFCNKRKKVVCRYNKKAQTCHVKSDAVKNKNSLRFGNTVIVFIDSEASNKSISIAVGKAIEAIGVETGRNINFTVTGKDSGLRLEMLKRIVERVLQDCRVHDKVVTTMNYDSFLNGVFG